MSDQQIEEEVELQAKRDRRVGQSILTYSLIGLFGPIVCLLFPALGDAVGGWLI